MLLQSVCSWQLKPDYMRSSSSGAGGKSVNIGFLRFLSSTGEEHPWCLSTAVSEGIYGGCDISLPLMWVVKSATFGSYFMTELLVA